MILFKTDYLEISYAETERMVRSRWSGFVSIEEYRKGLVACLNIISNYEVKYWLEDYQSASGMNCLAGTWAEETWLPKFMAIAGDKLERIAKVMPAETIRKGN